MNNIRQRLMNKFKNRESGGYPELFFSFSIPNWNPLFKVVCTRTYVRLEPKVLMLRLIYANFTHSEIMHQIILDRTAQ